MIVYLSKYDGVLFLQIQYSALFSRRNVGKVGHQKVQHFVSQSMSDWRKALDLFSIHNNPSKNSSAVSVRILYRMDFSVPQQYRICTFEYREGTRASSQLVPKFRNYTLCNGGEPRYCRGTDWELQSSVPLSTAVPNLYSCENMKPRYRQRTDWELQSSVPT